MTPRRPSPASRVSPLVRVNGYDPRDTRDTRDTPANTGEPTPNPHGTTPGTHGTNRPNTTAERAALAQTPATGGVGVHSSEPPGAVDTAALAAVLAPLVADAVAARLAAERPRLLDAAALADALGMSRDWVYENAGRLGAIRLGDGPRPTLRFDLETALAALTDCQSGKQSDAPEPPFAGAQRRVRQRRRAARAQTVPNGGES